MAQVVWPLHQGKPAVEVLLTLAQGGQAMPRRLGFDQIVRVIGVPSPPNGFEGIACFRFLNRFNFGNFANPEQFGLEMPISIRP